MFFSYIPGSALQWQMKEELSWSGLHVSGQQTYWAVLGMLISLNLVYRMIVKINDTQIMKHFVHRVSATGINHFICMTKNNVVKIDINFRCSSINDVKMWVRLTSLIWKLYAHLGQQRLTHTFQKYGTAVLSILYSLHFPIRMDIFILNMYRKLTAYPGFFLTVCKSHLSVCNTLEIIGNCWHVLFTFNIIFYVIRKFSAKTLQISISKITVQS